MKTYQEYYNDWVNSTESRDLSFEEWLMWQLDRKEEQMVDKAWEVIQRSPLAELLSESWFRKAMEENADGRNVKERMLTWLSHNITKYYGTKDSWLHIDKMLADLEKHMEE